MSPAISILTRLVEALLQEKQQDVDSLHSKARELLPRLSHHDKGLVEENIRTTLRKFSELQALAERKRQRYRQFGNNLDAIRQEAEQYITWLHDTMSHLSQNHLPLALGPEELQLQLGEVQEVESRLQEKQERLQAVKEQAEAVLDDLPGPERQSVQLMLSSMQVQHTQVTDMVTSRLTELQDSRQLWQDFDNLVAKQQDWLDKRIKAFDQLDTMPLLTSDLEIQADKCKNLLSEVEGKSSQRDDLKASCEQLKVHCREEGIQQLDQKLADLTEQQKALAQRLKQQEEHLRGSMVSRRLFEADMYRVQQWCQETNITCSAQPPSDCATAVLEEELEQCKVLTETADTWESLVQEIRGRAEEFKQHLYGSDLLVLEQQLISLADNFQSTRQSVAERIRSLQSTLTSRRQVQDSIESSAIWLDDMQEQIRAADRSIGPTAEHAQTSLNQLEALEKCLAEYRPTLAQLNKRVETLRGQGQHSQVQSVLRMTSQYELLSDWLTRCRSSRQGALAVRRQLEEEFQQIQEALEAGRKEMESAAETGIPVPDRLLRYKVLQEKLASVQPQLSVVEAHARQIAGDCSQEDTTLMTSQLETASQELSALSAWLDAEREQWEKVQQDREDFEASMTDTITWLEDKVDILTSLCPLYLDADKVDPVLQKHTLLSGEALLRLEEMLQKAEVELNHFQEQEEDVPESFAQKVQQIRDLHTSTQEAALKKEEYLQEAKADRKQLEVSMRQVSDWLRGAEELLDSAIDGLDYTSLDHTLSEFTDYFSEASLCQEEMDQVTELSEKLRNTLDCNDTETLQQSLAKVNKRLAHVVAASQKTRQLLEAKTTQWRQFAEDVNELNECLEQLQVEWQQVDTGTLTTPEELDSQLLKVKVFTAKLEERRGKVGQVNEAARALLRAANSSSTDNINRLLLAINQRWDDALSQAEGKQAALEELQTQWQEFRSSLHGAGDVIRFAEENLASVWEPADSPEGLQEQLDLLGHVSDQLNGLAPQVDRLKVSSTSLQKALPSAEAKVTLQDHFLKLLETYERLQGSVKEQQLQMQEEVEERDRCQSQVTETLAWLTETQHALTAMRPANAQVDENTKKCKSFQQELAVRMEKTRHLTTAQEMKYASLGGEVPQQIRHQLTEIQHLQAEVAEVLRAKEEELVSLTQYRQEYGALRVKVTQWLHEAQQQLQQRVVNIPQARAAHQDLLTQFHGFKQHLDNLRSRGADLIRHSGQQAEKQEVQKAIASINHQWLSLQALTADRTQELSDAADLAYAVQDVTHGVQCWVTQAEGVIGLELDLSDFSSVREQLKSHKRLSSELGQNEDKLVALNAMVKQLDQVCVTTDNMAAVGALRQRVQHVSSEAHSRLDLLEGVNKQMEDYQKELAELTRWMEETKTRISMRDTTRDLREQLAVQQVGSA